MTPFPVTISVSILEDDELSNFVSYPVWSPNANVDIAASYNVAPLFRNRKLETTDKVLVLASGANLSTTPFSLHQLTDEADYTVSTDKTSKLVIILRSGTNNTTFDIKEDSSANAGTGTVKYNYGGTDFDVDNLMTVCPDWDLTEKTFATGKYITVDIIAGSATIMAAFVIES
jgi:hypothetical protein